MRRFQIVIVSAVKICKRFGFMGTSSPDPLQGLGSWTQLGDFCPPDFLGYSPPNENSWRRHYLRCLANFTSKVLAYCDDHIIALSACDRIALNWSILCSRPLTDQFIYAGQTTTKINGKAKKKQTRK